MEKLIIVYILKDKRNKNVFELKNNSDLKYFFDFIEPYCLTYDIYIKHTLFEEILFD